MKASITFEVLKTLSSFRRIHDAETCSQPPCLHCVQLHGPKIDQSVRNNEPIHFVLPAFPSKSASRLKVIGYMPDMAEVLALQFLDQKCQSIQDYYPPGAIITICSDGRVFSPIDRVSDEEVSQYSSGIQDIIRIYNLSNLKFFCLEDCLSGSPDELRGHLLRHYAPSLESLRSSFQNADPLVQTFLGIKRFMAEELLLIDGPIRTKSALAQESKRLAYLMIQRSQAWGEFISAHFPDALRLSIHPQPAHYTKIGIYMVETLDNWLTPWHGVAVKRHDQFELMKRYQAESLGAKLITQPNYQSHYILSPDSSGLFLSD